MAKSFDSVGLKQKLLKGIYSYGFEHMAVIQEKAIPLIINGRNVIIQSHSGTGKTGSFVISALHNLTENATSCEVLIIAPTHELALQIFDVASNLTKYMTEKVSLCIGKSSIDTNELAKSAVVIGTPGRIKHMLQKSFVNASTVKMLILDEADEMLNRDFAVQIRDIFALLPDKLQLCLFSATVTKETLETASKFVEDPEIILLEKDKLTLDGIVQFRVVVDDENDKYETFVDIFTCVAVAQTIVYANTQTKVIALHERLTKDNHTCGIIHSMMLPAERNAALAAFRRGDVRILISTDLLSRGIDIQSLSMVFNYELPYDKSCYIHRIGRSGRYGKRGVAINLVTKKEEYRVSELEKYYSTNIPPMPCDVQQYI